ncbi:hypothetical protein [Mucilaginibacter auburnensis]|uniref:Uncharacterized protein n=1 Tax=Mucilaginibacter auburnensis TaxID=1457233 RepID=A0A2H9VQN3_9SPHI|nr:hypothetical protein [Mucilaginibacter auburnensis]PJJ83157.1 hypothetical protein CLV57_0135 [Mucilaginibacter auburnensis]
MSKYFTLYTSAELICFITALVCLLSVKERYWRFFIAFMFLTCLVEFVATPLKEMYKADPKPENSNAWIYNLLLLLQIGTFLMMFYNLIGKYIQSKIIIFTGLVILLSLYGYELLTNQHGFYDYNVLTYSALSVIMILYSLYYYYLLLNKEEYTDLKALPEFWWTTGILFFFFGTTAINLFYRLLVSVSVSAVNTMYIFYINNILIVILYGCWTYAFICKRWMTSNK